MQLYPWLQKYDQAQKHGMYDCMTKNGHLSYLSVINVKFWCSDMPYKWQCVINHIVVVNNGD